jgi:hypothetical protein
VRFYSAATNLFDRLQVAMTHVSAGGERHNGKIVKSSSATAKRHVDSGFAGVDLLSCLACPEGAEDLDVERVATASLSWISGDGLTLSVAVNDGLAPFLGPEFEATLSDMLAFVDWSYGLAFRDRVDRQPEVHIFGGENGKLNKMESEALDKWYASTPAQRIQRPRNVYPITILNESQLGVSVNGMTLAQLIEASRETTLDRFGSLAIWRVPEDSVQGFRDLLTAGGALIATGPAAPPVKVAPRPESIQPPVPSRATGAPASAGQAKARKSLLKRIQRAVARAGDHPPVVGLEEYFEGNDQEDSIAPNQEGYGRPSLAELYRRFKEIKQRADVQTVLVSIHDDWEEALDSDEVWTAADCIHIYTSASEPEVEQWIEGMEADGIIAGWQRGRGKHPQAPQPLPKNQIFTVVWD